MFGRLQIIIIGGILLMGALTGIYYSWRSGIEREALLEYNQKQIEQNIKDQEEMKRKLADIDAKKKEIEQANEAEKKEFAAKLDSITSNLNSKEIKDKDSKSSDVLKETVRKLQGAVK